jgi:hypothetical protein
MPFSQISFGGSSIATFTPKVTCQQLFKTTTTRSCGQVRALQLEWTPQLEMVSPT